MLKKLLKYDLKDVCKGLIVFYALAIIFSVLTRIFFLFDNSTILNVVAHICSGTAISMFFNIIINSIIRCWVRFKKNIYGDESYLTHTLPIKKETQYLSKFLTAVITMFLGFLVILACLFIAYYSKENLEILKQSLEFLASLYSSTVIGLLLIIFIVVFLEMLFALIVGYTGLIIGHKFNNNKMLKTFISGFAIYMAMSGISLLIMFLLALFNPDIMNLFISNNITDINIMKTMMYIAIIIYTVYIAVLYVVNVKLFKKGVNVD